MKTVSQEKLLERQIQKHADHVLRAMEVLQYKVYDAELASEIARQIGEMANIYNEAALKLIESGTTRYHRSRFLRFLFAMELAIKTMFNMSTGNIALLLIKKMQDVAVDTEKVFRNVSVKDGTAKLARELLVMTEEQVKSLKEFL